MDSILSMQAGGAQHLPGASHRRSPANFGWLPLFGTTAWERERDCWYSRLQKRRKCLYSWIVSGSLIQNTVTPLAKLPFADLWDGMVTMSIGLSYRVM